MSASAVTVMVSKTKTKRLTAGYRGEIYFIGGGGEGLRTVLKLTMREVNLLAAKFPPRRPPLCVLRFSPQHNARVILTLPLTGMYAAVGSRIVCDCLRLYGKNSLYDRLRPAIRDRLRSFAIIWKPALIIFYFLNYYF